ncbi:cyclic AMP response element-binding protein B isoform X1 [Drosophila miranda]|uniref:cyclic AMP response element-binding protein B isoform X1 n=1 Tax=Drosophila miranda TaxID=7229 RepID=UPI0007E7539B|nr:cyclic AMP response element-binding protein B isoform X1 [Drosophila miranda]XP_017150555.1 cyclic AMP response element-binding protein B isoform X1 [Drosophila miranda]XP_017150565.1 cyclic AMP response element-binding protein B isoform X1 [Drosophila miranda]XP_017150573.1 cyclic AMP response element-binding protein B isoform X1 [Drosophila miranda]XP_017150583.1 cyclic AMP response element-binding protein B isoform X1 [Drosophila miranda]XP_017150591.1 cyclic AMP response element-binding
MDNSIVVEENGNSASSGSLDLITAAAQAAAAVAAATSAAQQQSQNPQSTTASTGNTNNSAGTGTVLTTTANCNLQYPMQPLAQHGLQVQSVIQANPSGVIQTAAGTQQHQALAAAAATATAMHKAVGVVYVAKPANSTVIHTTASNAVQVLNKIPPTFPCKIKPEPNSQHQEDSDESLSDDDSQHHRSELTRRPSYNKIFTEISGPDMSGSSLHLGSDGVLGSQLAAGGAGGNSANSPLLHMAPDPAYYLSNRIPYNTNNSGIAEDQTRKREIRLQKNREAARECRRKKKEYIKCLENRVAVLENQNKALIEELKSLKELYCQTKND